MKNMTKKISIAMTTYNGSQYIEELLDSLRLQTCPVQEVIIADDGSTDNTVNIVQNYIKKYDLVGWKIYINENNLGWKRNFKEVISKTTGDYIFLADQDDIWFIDKVEKLVNCLEKTNGWLVVSDFQTMGDEKYTKDAFMPMLKYNPNTQKLVFDEHYYLILRPGCVMAFTPELKKIFLELWDDSIAHDSLLWDIAMITDHAYYLNEPTIYFRRTGLNASSKMVHDLESQLSSLKMIQKVDEWYLESMSKQIDRQDVIRGNLQWCKYRRQLLENRQFSSWFKLLKYRKYYLTSKKYLGDIYYYLKA